MGMLAKRYEENAAEIEDISAVMAAHVRELGGAAAALEAELIADLAALGVNDVEITRSGWLLSLVARDRTMTIEPSLSGDFDVGYPKIEDHGFCRIQKSNKFRCNETEMLDYVLSLIGRPS